MLLPASGILNALLHQGELLPPLDIPVLDVTAVALQIVAALVRLRQYAKIEPSRVAAFARPSSATLGEIVKAYRLPSPQTS
jgi:hypothetical protein